MLTDAAGGRVSSAERGEPSETALFLPSPGLFRAVLDPGAPPTPGVTCATCSATARGPATSMITVELLPL